MKYLDVDSKIFKNIKLSINDKILKLLAKEKKRIEAYCTKHNLFSEEELKENFDETEATNIENIAMEISEFVDNIEEAIENIDNVIENIKEMYDYRNAFKKNK